MSKKTKDFIRTPFYPGGSKALEAFVSERLVYPAEALPLHVRGTVLLLLEIDSTGKVLKANLRKSLHPACDAEAQRVALLLRFEAPRNRGIRLVATRQLKIRFEPPPPAPPEPPQAQPQPVEIVYHFVPAKA